ncbi:MAG: hypothetical protein Ct9H300mP15_19490 [Gemmatimonadota bacterium]|nr:MAG: hypothetical protein Ct9H300mP15_19490 [Gemmatimonadota bacterium]
MEFVAPQVVHYGLDTLAIDILGTSGWTDSQVLETVDLRHTTGVVATASVGHAEDRNTSIQFREAYERHFQRSLISGVPALGYDTALLLIEGLKGGAESPEEIRIAIEGLREIEGAAGFTPCGWANSPTTEVFISMKASFSPLVKLRVNVNS